MMLLLTKHVELEIASFIFLRTPLLGSLYIGPDSGYGCLVRISPTEIDGFRREYIDRTRRTLRAQRS
jgi:hypothetical protein